MKIPANFVRVVAIAAIYSVSALSLRATPDGETEFLGVLARLHARSGAHGLHFSNERRNDLMEVESRLKSEGPRTLGSFRVFPINANPESIPKSAPVLQVSEDKLASQEAYWWTGTSGEAAASAAQWFFTTGLSSRPSAQSIAVSQVESEGGEVYWIVSVGANYETAASPATPLRNSDPLILPVDPPAAFLSVAPAMILHRRDWIHGDLFQHGIPIPDLRLVGYAEQPRFRTRRRDLPQGIRLTSQGQLKGRANEKGRFTIRIFARYSNINGVREWSRPKKFKLQVR